MLAPTYPIVTERLLLRPFEAADRDALYELQRHPEVARYLYWLPSSREEVAEALAKRSRQMRIVVEGDALVLAVVVRDSGTLVGDVILGWRSAEPRQGEIGYILHPDYQGLGYATETSRTTLALGFEGLGLHRIVARCDARNAASVRVMERLGMRREAHFRENQWAKGEWTDELVHALIAREWVEAERRADRR